MALAPHVRRERRAYNRKQELLTNPPAKLPRRRCLNCNGWFLKTRKNKKFCKKECKDEYNRYGSAFGPLKEWIGKLIEKLSKETFERRLRVFLETEAGRAAITAAGFIHRDELQAYATDAQLQLVLMATRNITERVTALERRRRKPPGPQPGKPGRRASR